MALGSPPPGEGDAEPGHRAKAAAAGAQGRGAGATSSPSVAIITVPCASVGAAAMPSASAGIGEECGAWDRRDAAAKLAASGCSGADAVAFLGLARDYTSGIGRKRRAPVRRRGKELKKKKSAVQSFNCFGPPLETVFVKQVSKIALISPKKKLVVKLKP